MSHIIVFVLVFVLAGCSAMDAPTPPQPTNASTDKIFDEFSYAITSQNWTAVESFLHANVTALLTDVGCSLLHGSSAVIAAFQEEMSNAVVESINRQSSVQSNTSAMIWATVTGFASSHSSPSSPNGANEKDDNNIGEQPWWIFEPMALFTMRISPDSAKIVDFRRYVSGASIRNDSNALYLQSVTELFDSIVNKNGTAFASLFSKSDEFHYVGHPEGQGFPIDEYNKSELVSAVVSRFPVTTHDAVFTPTVYATCNVAVIDATQLAWYAPPATSSVSLQETSANILTFDPYAGTTTGSIVKWERWYWNNISVW